MRDVVDVLPTETITFKKVGKPKIFDNFLDFQVLTKSGKIMIFEFKKNALRSDDLKQAYDYYMNVYCKDRPELRLIIVVISKSGKISEFSDWNVTFHPDIVQTKKIDKSKDLKSILDKFENNEMLTSRESSLLVALPLFETGVDECILVETFCEFIKFKSECIPSEMIDEITIATYLNILEYVDVENQDELMEMIGMSEKCEGIVAQIKRESKKEGLDEGKMEGKKAMLESLLQNISLDDVVKYSGMDKSEILRILNAG